MRKIGKLEDSATILEMIKKTNEIIKNYNELLEVIKIMKQAKLWNVD